MLTALQDDAWGEKKSVYYTQQPLIGQRLVPPCTGGSAIENMSISGHEHIYGRHSTEQLNTLITHINDET